MIARVDGILARAIPAEGFEHIHVNLGVRKGQAGPISLIREGSELPSSLRFAQVDELPDGPPTVLVHVQLFAFDSPSRDKVKRVDDLLGSHSSSRMADNELGGLWVSRSQHAPLVGVRVED